MKSFGLVDTWSENCADSGAFRATFALPFFGTPTVAMSSNNAKDGNGKLEGDIASASLVTVDKLKIMVSLTTLNGVRAPKPMPPAPGLYEKIGNKMRVDGRTSILEKCLN